MPPLSSLLLFTAATVAPRALGRQRFLTAPIYLGLGTYAALSA